MTTAADCFREEIVLNYIEVDLYLRELGYDTHSGDDLVAMWEEYMNFGNDRYCQLYRHWIKTDAGRLWWDTICEELGIVQVYENLTPGKPYISPTRLVFWVSW